MKNLALALVALLMPAILHAQESNRAALEQWRSQGARPVLIAMLADGSLNANERAALEELAGKVGQPTRLQVPGNAGELTVTPTASDAALFSAVLEGVALNSWFQGSNQRYYVQIAMLSDAMWARLKRHTASKFLAWWNQSVESGDPRVMEDGLIGWSMGSIANPVPEFEHGYLMQLGVEALRMIEADGVASFPPEVYRELGATQ